MLIGVTERKKNNKKKQQLYDTDRSSEVNARSWAEHAATRLGVVHS